MSKALRLCWQIPYSIYCWLLFACVIIVCCLLAFLVRGIYGEQRFSRMFCRLARIPILTFGALSGIQLVYQKQYDFDIEKPYIFVGNHTSMLDMAFIAFTPLNIRVLAKAEIKRIPFLNLIGNLIAIYVQRYEGKSREESLVALRQLAQKNLSLVIFPEGTRHIGPEALGVFHKGAFQIAIEHQLPLLPAVITGGRKVMGGKKALLWHPGRMEMFFLPPIPTTGLTMNNLDALMGQVKSSIATELRKYEPNL